MLNAATIAAGTSLCLTRQRRDLIAILLSEIAYIFPQVSYELDLGSRTVNAQALARGPARAVRLYGGFALHPLVGADALMFSLLHETGHHLAGGHRFAGDPMLACDCAADAWALTWGAASWHRRFCRSFDIGTALDAIEAAVASSCGELSSTRARGARAPKRTCWATDWPARRSRLCGQGRLEIARRCCMS